MTEEEEKQLRDDVLELKADLKDLLDLFILHYHTVPVPTHYKDIFGTMNTSKVKTEKRIWSGL